MATTNNSSADQRDFSEPWKLSNVVLVVEEQRFHVHRSTLAMWSPVFEKMFTSDFKEKDSGEIQLPGKKASEIKELLQIMYPSLEEKVVTKSNCYFLLDLAREYQITSITQKCEDFLVTAVKSGREYDVLSTLIVAQEYGLKTLIRTCVSEACRLSMKQLKGHSKRAEVDPDNYLEIAEGIIARLEEQCKVVKTGILMKVHDLGRSLYYHARSKGGVYPIYPNKRSTRSGSGTSTVQYLNALESDKTEHNCSSSSGICPSLSSVAKNLREIKNTIETLP